MFPRTRRTARANKKKIIYITYDKVAYCKINDYSVVIVLILLFRCLDCLRSHGLNWQTKTSWWLRISSRIKLRCRGKSNFVWLIFPCSLSAQFSSRSRLAWWHSALVKIVRTIDSFYYYYRLNRIIRLTSLKVKKNLMLFTNAHHRLELMDLIGFYNLIHLQIIRFSTNYEIKLSSQSLLIVKK